MKLKSVSTKRELSTTTLTFDFGKKYSVMFDDGEDVFDTVKKLFDVADELVGNVIKTSL